MIKITFKIYGLVVAIFAIPFALFARLPIQPWHFYYCAIFASKIPFLFGDFFRESFYKITLKDFGKNNRIMHGVVIQTRDCSVGNNVLIGLNTLISHASIGDDVLIGPCVHIIPGSKSHGSERTDIPMRLQGGHDQYVTIGSDVWIGANAIILTSIDKGAILGAGSILTKPLGAYDVAVGNPAKIIKNRKK